MMNNAPPKLSESNSVKQNTITKRRVYLDHSLLAQFSQITSFQINAISKEASRENVFDNLQIYAKAIARSIQWHMHVNSDHIMQYVARRYATAASMQ